MPDRAAAASPACGTPAPPGPPGVALQLLGSLHRPLSGPTQCRSAALAPVAVITTTQVTQHRRARVRPSMLPPLHVEKPRTTSTTSHLLLLPLKTQVT